MSLVTRCPRCRTLFRVTPAQLQIRAGTVRCGRCMHAFDGFAGLGAEALPALSPPAPAESVDSIASATRPLQAPSVKSREKGREPATPSARAMGSPAQPSPDAGSPLFAGELRGAARRDKWTVGSALLLVVLALQAVYVYRSEISARVPIAKSTFATLCNIADCTITLPQRPDLVKIEASDVHMIDPARPGLVQLTATLRSYASYDLAFPALDLVLTNANEHALARRIFVPDEYLDATRDPQRGIPAHAEITLALDLDTADLNAAGFRLDLLAAPAP